MVRRCRRTPQAKDALAHFAVIPFCAHSVPQADERQCENSGPAVYTIQLNSSSAGTCRAVGAGRVSMRGRAGPRWRPGRGRGRLRDRGGDRVGADVLGGDGGDQPAHARQHLGHRRARRRRARALRAVAGGAAVAGRAAVLVGGAAVARGRAAVGGALELLLQQRAQRAVRRAEHVLSRCGARAA